MQTINNDREVLEFSLSDSDEVYHIPMPRSLPAKMARNIDAAIRAGEDFSALFYDLLDEFAPGVTDRATLSAIQELAVLWSKASEEQEGVSLGE